MPHLMDQAISHSTQQITAADEAAVAALPHQMAAAWDRGDADAYAAIFTPEADYVVFDGSHARGRAEIAGIHLPLFARFLKGSRLIIDSVETRFLDPDVALIHSSGGVQRKGQSKVPKPQQSVQTMVAVRRDGGWQLTAFQNTRYKPFSDTFLWKLAQLLPGGRTKLD
jgi:uncharacterized protein (TIGR02246 family)